MKLSEIITTWHKLSSGDTVDQSNVFFRFVALWIAFNGIYGARYDKEPAEASKISEFAGEPDMFKRHTDLLASDKNYYQAVEYLAAKGVMDLSNPGDIYEIKKHKNLRQVMRCVYQIRNNLFHSGKVPGNPRDENLVDAAFTIVSKLIEPWCNPEWIDSWAEPGLSAYELSD